jgi:hypothetical protein
MERLLKKVFYCFITSYLTLIVLASTAPQKRVQVRPQPRPVHGPVVPRQAVPDMPSIEQMLDRQHKLEKELIPDLERKIADKEKQIEALLMIVDEARDQAWYRRDIDTLMQEKEALTAQKFSLLKQCEEVNAGIIKILGITGVKPKIEEKPLLKEKEKVVKSDIDVITEEYSRPAPGDGKLCVKSLAPNLKSEIVSYKNLTAKPKEFAGGLALVTQLGALGQKRSPEDYNNYCGYYAAYNLKCFLKGRDEKSIQANLLDRKTFSENFSVMLQEIKKAGHPMPYDNLQEEEIIKLLRAQGIVDDQYVCLKLTFGLTGENTCNLTDVGLAYGQPALLGAILQVRYADVKDFRAGIKRSLNILYNVGALHWLAIMVHRTDYGIHFYVADSLGDADWTSDTLIKERLEPLYRLIMDE